MTGSRFSNGYALLIGVGADLPMTVNDATMLYNVLISPSRAAYPPEQIELLIEKRADRQGILDAFDRLAKRVQNDPVATVIVYFSGHGGQNVRVGAPVEYFLVPFGYDPQKRGETAISGLEFTNKIEAIKARKLIVFLDCCRAGGIPVLKDVGERFVKSPLPPDLFRVLTTGSGLCVVSSSLATELSEADTLNSIFTACLLDALKGKASPSKDGYARILDILIYLYEQVPLRTAGSQHPFVNKVLNLHENFPLCYYAGGSKSLPEETLLDQFSVLHPIVPSTLSTRKRGDLERRRKSLLREQAIWEEKIALMREEHAIAHDVRVQFELDYHLRRDSEKLDRVDYTLDEIDRQLQ